MDFEKQYTKWNLNLWQGVIIGWPVGAAFLWIGLAVIDAGGGVSIEMNFFVKLAVFFALILALGCLHIAKRIKEDGRTKLAVRILQIPFLYLIVFVIALMASDSLD